MQQNKIPCHYLCPATRIIMKNPSTASDNITYEKLFLQEWFKRGFATSPLTGEILLNLNLKDNQVLKKEIQTYIQQHPQVAKINQELYQKKINHLTEKHNESERQKKEYSDMLNEKQKKDKQLRRANAELNIEKAKTKDLCEQIEKIQRDLSIQRRNVLVLEQSIQKLKLELKQAREHVGENINEGQKVRTINFRPDMKLKWAANFQYDPRNKILKKIPKGFFLKNQNQYYAVSSQVPFPQLGVYKFSFIVKKSKQMDIRVGIVSEKERGKQNVENKDVLKFSLYNGKVYQNGKWNQPVQKLKIGVGQLLQIQIDMPNTNATLTVKNKKLQQCKLGKQFINRDFYGYIQMAHNQDQIQLI